MNTSSKFIFRVFLMSAFVLLYPVQVLAQSADNAKKASVVEIVSMKYGSRPDNLVAVTAKTLDMLKSGAKVTISKSIVAMDPAPGEKKYAILVYSVDGSRSSVKIMDGETFEFASVQKEYGQKTDSSAKEADSKTSGAGQKTDKAGASDFKSSVNTAVDEVSKAVDSKVVGIHLLAYSKGFKNISDNPDVEKIMGIDNEWYLNISKMLAEMGKYKLELELSQDRNLKDRMEVAQKNYAELSKKFKYLIEHPVKIQRK